MNTDLIVAALLRGDPVVLPTDTVYGLVAIASDVAAVSAIFEAKQRPIDVLAAVLVRDMDQASTIVEFSASTRRLAEEFWPGALTIVAPRRPDCRLAVGDERTVGVRCPDDDLMRTLAGRVGPLAATSANVHGQPTPPTADEVAALFPKISVVVDGGPRTGRASTVVDITGPEIVIVREGPISASEIAACLDGAP